MAGEFLPPVITTLDGDIQPLLDKLLQAKAAIKALGDTSFTIPINVEINQASIAKAKAMLAAELQGSDMKVNVSFDVNSAGLAAGIAAARAVASAGVTIPVRYDYAPFGSGEAGRGWPGMAVGSSFLANAVGATYPFRSDNGPGIFDRMTAAGLSGFPGQSYPTWSAPRPWWLGGTMINGGRMSYSAVHVGAIGLAAGAMGIAGGLFNLGAGAAVLGPGAANIASRGNLYNQSLLATIPPGVPDNAIARAFGYNGPIQSSPIGRATQIGSGMDLSALGGLVALTNKNGVLGSLVAQHGLSVGSTLDNLIGRQDLRGGNGSTLSKFVGDITSDASNLGGALSNTGAFLGHAFSHMPGEIEWATTGLKDVTGYANDIFTTPGLKTVAGDALFGGLLLHSTALGAHLLGGAANLVGKLPFIPSGLGGTAARVATAEDVAAGRAATVGEKIGGSGLLGLGMLNPYILGAAAAVGTGLAAYRYQTPTSAMIGAMANQVGLGKAGPINAGSYGANALGELGNAMQQASTSTSSQSYLGHVLSNTADAAGYMGLFGHGAGLVNALSFGLLNKELSPSEQNANLAAKMTNQLSAYGGSVRAVANALGISTAEAGQLLGMSGAKIGPNGVVGGNAMAIRLAQNVLNGQRINTGGNSMAMMNIGVGQMVGDSAWQSATTINGNFDTYMGELGAGGSTLGGFQSAKQLAALYAANIAAAPAGTYVAPTTGLAATSAALGATGEPGADFFRTAMAAGAIRGPAAGNSIVELAGALSPYAGNNKAAQAQLVALANSGGGFTKNGVTTQIKSYQQLMSLIGSATKAQQEYTNSVQTTTIKMSNLPGIFAAATKASTADQATQIGALINKFPSIKNAFDQVANDMADKKPLSQTIQDAETLATKMAANKAPVSVINGMLQSMGLSIQAVQGNHGIHFTVTASEDALTSQIMKQFAGKPNVIPASTVLPGGQSVHALGGTAQTGQWSWVGEKGPEMMYMPAGSHVTPAFRTGQVMANAMSGASGDGGTHHHHIYIDGKEFFNVIKKQTYQYNSNNGNRDAQGRLAGTMRPR